MDEYVLVATLRLDETKALRRIEELYGACGRMWVSFPD